MVIVNNLTVSIKNQILVNDATFLLTAGHITIFIGKSGAGKTTVLKTLVGLIPTTAGVITLDNKKTLAVLKAQQRAQEIGYVFQDFNLFPQLTVLQNCEDPLINQGISASQAQKQALAMLQKLGVDVYAQKYPAELSGGQQQRVAIARALCLKPKVMILDEPTASLDPANTDILVSILKSLAQEGLTIAVSSQDMSFVRKIFDRAYYIESGEILETCESMASLNKCPLIQGWLV